MKSWNSCHNPMDNTTQNNLCTVIGLNTKMTVHTTQPQTWKKSQACKQFLWQLWTILDKPNFSCSFYPSMTTILHYHQQLIHFWLEDTPPHHHRNKNNKQGNNIDIKNNNINNNNSNNSLKKYHLNYYWPNMNSYTNKNHNNNIKNNIYNYNKARQKQLDFGLILLVLSFCQSWTIFDEPQFQVSYQRWSSDQGYSPQSQTWGHNSYKIPVKTLYKFLAYILC